MEEDGRDSHRTHTQPARLSDARTGAWCRRDLQPPAHEVRQNGDTAGSPRVPRLGDIPFAERTARSTSELAGPG